MISDDSQAGHLRQVARVAADRRRGRIGRFGSAGGRWRPAAGLARPGDAEEAGRRLLAGFARYRKL